MSQAIFPAFVGRGFSSFRRPTWQTRKSQRTSGKVKRAKDWTYPKYQFELQINALRDDAVRQELQRLQGFFNSMGGGYDTFLYLDPTDNWVSSQVIGVGDGSTTLFPVLRNVGSWVEPIGQVANQPTVTVAGEPSNAWSIALPNFVEFQAPPAPGAQIAVVDLQFYFVCTFDDDVWEFENFMRNVWLNKSIKFTTEK